MAQFKAVALACVLVAGGLGPSASYSHEGRFSEGSVALADQYAKRREAAQKRFLASLKQAQQGAEKAQYEVGLIYLLPIEEQVEPDAALAFQWFMKSAQQGYLPAQEEVARCYSTGEGVNQDQQQAFYWNQQAAEQGSRESLLSVAWAYTTGEGVAVAPEKAKSIYLEFVSNTNDPLWSQAAVALIRLYEKHDPKDHASRLYWMEAAYAKGAIHLDRDLVHAYSEGKLLPPDDVKTRYYLSKMRALSRLKDADKFLLATLYEEGRGGSTEVDQAHVLFNQLVQAGYPEAILRNALQQKRVN